MLLADIGQREEIAKLVDGKAFIEELVAELQPGWEYIARMERQTRVLPRHRNRLIGTTAC